MLMHNILTWVIGNFFTWLFLSSLSLNVLPCWLELPFSSIFIPDDDISSFVGLLRHRIVNLWLVTGSLA